MKNRMAWGMIAILALVVMGGSTVLYTGYRHSRPEQPDDMALYFQKRGLVIGYKSHLPPLWRRVTLLPRSDWGFGRCGSAVIDESTRTVFECREEFRIGFLQIQLK